MAKRDLFLAQAASGPALEESQSTHDDLPIPLIDQEISDDLWPSQEVDAPRPPTAKHWLWGLALGGAAIVAGLWLQQGGTEKRHENWQHVEAASQASTDFAQQLIHFDGAGNETAVRSLTVTGADRNLGATQELRSALRRNDLVTATATLQTAQGLQSVADNAAISWPELLPDLPMTADLRNGRAELFEIELFDCCDEDGDVVELLVNGTPFATVPLINGGSVVAIPLSRGQNSITMIATRDGGGGVTVSLRTSRGHYFARYMAEGESHQMGVVVQ
ncbi:MAG: hypothetical protein KDB22_27715 [Planctomycetales bacterium]|nr:hypothetical protein [Planctomycetales bacterium]